MLKLAAVAAFGLAGAAESQVIVQTYTGIALRGVDNDGFFGAVGTDVSGMHYTLTYTLDLHNPLMAYFEAGGYGAFNYQGAGTATLTMNGHSVRTDWLTNAGRGYEPVSDAPPLVSFLNSEGFNKSTAPLRIDINTSIGFLDKPFNIDPGTDFSYNLTDAQWALADLIWGSADYSGTTTYFYTGTSQAQSSLLMLQDHTISIRTVPEPASWALMVAGFGLAGAAMRRRKFSVQQARG